MAEVALQLCMPTHLFGNVTVLAFQFTMEKGDVFTFVVGQKGTVGKSIRHMFLSSVCSLHHLCSTLHLYVAAIILGTTARVCVGSNHACTYVARLHP